MCPHPIVRPSIRVQQPPGGVSTVELGHHDVAQETEALMKSRPESGSRKSEMNGSVSRGTDSGNGDINIGAREAGMRIHQPADGFSQRSFQIGGEESALLDRLITNPAATRPNNPGDTTNKEQGLHSNSDCLEDGRIKSQIVSECETSVLLSTTV